MLDGVSEPSYPTFTEQDATDAEAAAAAAEAAFLQADLDAAAAGAAASARINAAVNAAEAAAQAVRDEAAVAFQGEIDSANSELTAAREAASAAFQTAEDASEQTYTEELAASEQQTLAEDASSLTQYNDDLQTAEQSYGTAAQAATDALAAANAALEAALAASELQIEGDYQTGNAAAQASYQTDLAGIQLAYDGAVEAANQAKTTAIDAANATYTATVSAAAATRDAALASYSGVAYDRESVAEDPTFLSAVAATQTAYDVAVAAAEDAFADAVLDAYGIYQSAMSAAEAALNSAVLIANGHRTDAYAAANAAYDATATAASQTFSAAAAEAADHKAQAIAAAEATYDSAEAALTATRIQTVQAANDAYLQARATAQQQYDSDFGADDDYFNDEIADDYEDFLNKLNQAISTYDEEMAAANATYLVAATMNSLTYQGIKNGAWATYQTQRTQYESEGSSAIDWTIYISSTEILYYEGFLSHDDLLRAYRAYAIASAGEHVSFLMALRTANMQYLNTERDAATQLAENMAQPSLDYAEDSAEAAAKLATTRVNEAAKFERSSAQWDSERWISEAYYWADLQIAFAEAEKAKLDVETQANLAYDLAEEGLNLTREKARIAADAACNDDMTQAEAAQARTLANATHTRTVAFATAERAYFGEVAQANLAFAISSNAAVASFGEAIINAGAPHSTAVAAAYATAMSAVATARASAITIASNGDPDVAFVASTWATFDSAATGASGIRAVAAFDAQTTFDLIDLNAWHQAMDQDVAAQAAFELAQADLGLQWEQMIANADLQAELASIDAETANYDSLNAAAKAEAEGKADAEAAQNRRAAQATADQAERDDATALKRMKATINHEREQVEAQITAETTALLAEIDASKAVAKKLIDADKDKAIAAAQAAKAEVSAGAAEDKRVALADAELAHADAIHGAFVHLRMLQESPLSTFEGNPGPGIGAALNWMYNDGLDHATNFMTGWMDGLSGGWWSRFGQGTYLTQYVDYNSGTYMGGSIVGSVHGFVLGGAAGPCAGGWAGAVARAYTTTMTGVGLVEAGYHAVQGEMGIADFLALAPVAGRLGGRVLGFNCFVAGTPVATGWVEAPELAITVPATESGFERASWIAIGLGTVVLTSAAARRLRRSDEEESLRARTRALRPVLSGWDRFDEEQRPRSDDSAVDIECDAIFDRPQEGCNVDEHELRERIPKMETPSIVVSRKVTTAIPPHRRIRSAMSAVVSLCGLLAGGLCFWQSGAMTGGRTEALASSVAKPSAPSSLTLSTIPIEQIRPGMRVLADNPELASSPLPDSPVDVESWRLIRLELKKDDGERVDVDLLRPFDWILTHALTTQDSPAEESKASDRGDGESAIWQALLIGRSIEIDLPEFGAQGAARVLAVDPCPPIESPAPGKRLVTGAFHHTSTEVVDLRLADGSPTIGTTSNHPFWSDDRQTFVRADQLRIGERLRKSDGRMTSLVRVSARPGRASVYNFEVDIEHVYFVGSSGVLVHNACAIQDMHHSIPRWVQRQLPARIRNSPDVRGRPGLPNRIAVDRTLHRQIHGGQGYPYPGGHYNNRFMEEIEAIQSVRRLQVQDVLDIRDLLVIEFGL